MEEKPPNTIEIRGLPGMPKDRMALISSNEEIDLSSDLALRLLLGRVTIADAQREIDAFAAKLIKEGRFVIVHGIGDD